MSVRLNELTINSLKAPTAANGTTYGYGTSGQVLKTDGDSVYWGNDANTTYEAEKGITLVSGKFGHSNTAITAGSVGSAQSPSHGGTFAIPQITYDAYGHITAATTVNITLPSDNNTHYTTHLYAGVSGGKANAATVNGNTHLLIVDDSTNRDSIKLTGSGATTVTSDASGVITISSTNTTYDAATTSAAGLMSATDKAKLDGIAAGATANTGTITEIKMNGASKGASGVVDLGTVITEHQDISGKADTSKVPVVAYGTCSTTAATAAKVVTLTSATKFELIAGAIIGVKFSASNSASNVTLNVNGSGAKSIWYNNAAYTSNSQSICGYKDRTTYYMYDGTYWVWLNMGTLDGNSNTVPCMQCETAAGTAAKAATCTNFSLLAKSYSILNVRYANSSATALTLNVNSTGAKPIYINGTASSASNYTLPAGSYLIYYDGTNYYVRTDGKMTGDITGNAATASQLNNALTFGDASSPTYTYNGSSAINIPIYTGLYTKT